MPSLCIKHCNSLFQVVQEIINKIKNNKKERNREKNGTYKKEEKKDYKWRDYVKNVFLENNNFCFICSCGNTYDNAGSAISHIHRKHEKAWRSRC